MTYTRDNVIGTEFFTGGNHYRVGRLMENDRVMVCYVYGADCVSFHIDTVISYLNRGVWTPTPNTEPSYSIY